MTGETGAWGRGWGISGKGNRRKGERGKGEMDGWVGGLNSGVKR